MSLARRSVSRPASEIVRLDLKEYETQKIKLSVSQIKVSDTALVLVLVMEKRSKILTALSSIRSEKGY